MLKQTPVSILDNFNLDGTNYENPVEKLKEQQDKRQLKKKLFIKFLIISALGHLLQFLIFHKTQPKPKQPNKEVDHITIPNGHGQISIHGELAFVLKDKVTRVKILNRKRNQVLATGYIRKEENIHLIRPEQFLKAPKIAIYVAYTKFEKLLKYDSAGILIVPIETRVKQGVRYEIEI